MSPFFLYRLRTRNVDAARDFYRRVLGASPLEIFELHEQALARGARPHWLGLLQVADVEQTAASFVARGAQTLGPKWQSPDGLEGLSLRDPGGAVMGLARPPAILPEVTSSGPDVVWHSLNTPDVERARIDYTELLGWQFGESLDLGNLGRHQSFSWQPGGAHVGSIGDIENRPGMHPHWLFHFRVAALEPALRAVLDGKGTALTPITLPNGARIAVCDDPQGAAFALHQQSP